MLLKILTLFTFGVGYLTLFLIATTMVHQVSIMDWYPIKKLAASSAVVTVVLVIADVVTFHLLRYLGTS